MDDLRAELTFLFQPVTQSIRHAETNACTYRTRVLVTTGTTRYDETRRGLVMTPQANSPSLVETYV